MEKRHTTLQSNIDHEVAISVLEIACCALLVSPADVKQRHVLVTKFMSNYVGEYPGLEKSVELEVALRVPKPTFISSLIFARQRIARQTLFDIYAGLIRMCSGNDKTNQATDAMLTFIGKHLGFDGMAIEMAKLLAGSDQVNPYRAVLS